MSTTDTSKLASRGTKLAILVVVVVAVTGGIALFDVRLFYVAVLVVGTVLSVALILLRRQGHRHDGTYY